MPSSENNIKIIFVILRNQLKSGRSSAKANGKYTKAYFRMAKK